MSGRAVRVAHLVSHPIQYFAPLYRELARRRELDLTVYFYSDATAREFFDPEFGRPVSWDVPLLEGYSWKICPSAAGRPLSRGFLERPHWDVVREVAGGGYDAVWVNGYSHPTTWLACVAARARGAKVLIREEQTLLHGRSLPKRALKQVALRALFSQAYGLYIGEQNRRYFRHYGMPESRLFATPYCVDNRFFSERAAELAPRRDELRARFGITNDAPVVLFAGKLVAKKQPLLLLEAFAQVRRRRECWLLVAGDGPLRRRLEEQVEREAIEGVRLAGFLNQTELPAAYAAADAFVLPSSLHETWGLVVNEAMNFSLPVVVSDKVGCGADLVRPRWNGYVFDHRSADELAAALSALVADAELRRAFGARSRALVGRYSIEACAEGVVAACLAGAVRRRRELVAAARP